MKQLIKDGRIGSTILVFISCAFSFFYSQSQILNNTNIAVPPSPNASALLEYANIPVDYYTGIPGINVPLYSLEGRDITIPIGVSYHASGIKVQDVASSVGLGWNLYAGGAITRVVKGQPDGNTYNCGIDPTHERYLSSFFIGGCDHEPDIFYFNFLGQTGKFFLDKNLVPYMSPHGYSKIQPLLNGAPVSTVPIDNEAPTIVGSTLPGSRWAWRIIDENGYQYYFGEDANSTEVSTLWKILGTYQQDDSFISTWYLTKIISPKGIQVATFTYSKGNSITTEYFSSTKSNLVLTSGDCQNAVKEKTANTSIRVVIENPLYPSVVSTSLGSVSFSFLDGRRDGFGKYLDEVAIKDVNQVQINKYSFQYGYFKGIKARIWQSYPTIEGLGCNSNECVFRLKLIGIVDNSLIKVREFFYNEEFDLPKRNSNYIDHWGYYNWTSNNYNSSDHNQSRIPKLDFNDPNLATNGTSRLGLGSFSGANKRSEPYLTEANSLTQIKYPTGGITKFFYEGNLADDGSFGGGLRIQKIEDYNDASTLVGRRSYTYEQGKKYRDPVYHYLVTGGDLGQDCFMGFICWDAGCGVTLLVRHSSSLNDMFDLNGISVGYGKVTETLQDNSRIERFFSNFDTRPDSEPTIKIYQGKSSSYTEFPLIPTDSYGPPFSPKTSYSWERGLLLREKLYDSNTKLISESQYNYDFGLPTIKQILCKTVESTSQTNARSSSDQQNIVRVGTYYINIKPINLLNTTQTIYGQTPISGSSPASYSAVTTTTTINKHPTYPNYVQSVVTNMPDGSQTKTEYRYVFDLVANITTVRGPDDNTLGFLALSAQNNISSPIEVISSYKKLGGTFKVVGAELKTFKWHSSSVAVLDAEWSLQVSSPISDFVPATIGSIFHTFFKDSRYRLINLYTHDNTALTLKRQDPSSGVPNSYDWGFNNTLITAAYVNPGTNQFKTEYINKPLVGLASIRDANLQTVNYEYDKSNRLRIVKDTDGNIVQRYRYHYKDGMDNAIDFKYLTYSSSATDNTLQFIAQGAGELGSSLIWDFGNGIVQENGASTQLQTYPTPGFYDVKLAVNHPEYSTSTVTKTIRILPPIIAQITSPIVSTNVTVCGSSHATTCTVVTNGETYAYQWEYSYSGYGNGNYLPIGTNSPTLIFNNSGVQNSSTSIRCKITDAAGNSRYSSYVTVFHYCSGQPGPSDCPSGWTWNSQHGHCEPPAETCGDGCFWNGNQCVCY